jgi:hypothetical protein
MSNRSDLFEFVAELTEEAAGVVLAKLGATPADVPAPAVAVTDAPDENGAVALLQVTNQSWQGKRFIIQRVAESLQPGSLARATAELNEGEALTRYNFGIPMVPGFLAHQYEPFQNEKTGMPDFRLKREGPNNSPVTIPGTHAVPPIIHHGFDCRTEEGLTACLNWLPVSSTTVNPDFSPHN